MKPAPDNEEADDLQPVLPVILDEADQRLAAVFASTAAFSGLLTERDQSLVDAILSSFVAGATQRQIAERFKVSRNTIAQMVRRAEADGRLEPYKARLSARLGRAVEAGIEHWTEAVEAGKVSASQIPVAVGIFTDKKLLLDGEATSRVEHVQRVTPEQLLADMKQASISIT